LYFNKQYFQLFGEKEFDTYEREQIVAIKDEIERESENYILKQLINPYFKPKIFPIFLTPFSLILTICNPNKLLSFFK
jgi:uncharacterized membrane protein